MINTKLLAELCEAAGAPGHENRVREIVLKESRRGDCLHLRIFLPVGEDNR